MPSRAPSREASSTSSGRASQRLKFKDKVVKSDNCIRPPHSDLPFEFVKNADDLFVVQTKSCGSQHLDEMRKGVKEEELVKYMSKVPSFLQRGQKFQDNVLNFGVLDWGRLEQWTHKHEKVVQSDKISKPFSESCSSSAGCSSGITQNAAFAHSREQPSSSNSSSSVHLVDYSPIVKPLSEKVSDLHSSFDSFLDGKKETHKKDTHRRRYVNTRSSKYKERYLGHNSSNCDHEGLEKGRRNLNNSDGEVLKCSEAIEELKLDTRDQYRSGKQQGIVLLFPKDFSGSESSKEHGRASLDGKSAEYNWGSFSDIFSIDEIHPEDSFAEVPHSCSLGSALELEKVLDLKLDTLIKSQGVEIPVNPSDMPVHDIETIESKVEVATSSSTIPKGLMDRNVKHFSDEIHGNNSLHSQLSSGLAKLTRSLSFRESSDQPPLSTTYVTAKSGPAKPEHRSTYTEFQNSNKASFNVREKVNPFRRLLDPIFKFKVEEQLDERSYDLIVKPAPVPMNEEHEPVTIKALLHFTVKSGLPLFKFVVGKNDEIFASTVKSLITSRKDEMSWLYTFYSVQKISKRSSKKNHQNVKPSRLVYNIVGQMKVSEPHSPSWCEHKSEESHVVKESVLYNVEESNADGVTSEIKTSRELAAVVVNMPNAAGKFSRFYTEDNLNDCFSDSEHQKLGHIVVILPGGDHSIPHDGVPSSLITRWRNGGSCDCGGWDIGCKLRILTEKWQQHKYLQAQCDLYDQEAKQNTPFFSLIPLRDGLFSVEYDVQISSLQAFSISVALINSHTSAYSPDAIDQVESKQLGSTKASMTIKSKGPEKHAPHPPLSPAGRV